QFNDAAGHYDLLDSGSVVASGTWTPGAPVSYNGFALSLDGVPAAGDSFTIAPTLNPASNNGNALAFDTLAARLLVDGQTVTDDYAETLATVGSQVQGMQAASDTSQDVASRAQEALTGEVGVNLDEEAAKLIQYQQAYQAAAKMLQTAQSMMDTLMQIGH
ncbi:MAG: flagellar hook-associated protein FlgK, partial [Burkholderiales bacterium]|nr:flagellar hook-associated protein FlgK [Burkholderiales bacterium]